MSNWRAKETLENFLKKQQVIAISDIDTRALTQHIRTHGSQPACIMIGNPDAEQALHFAQNFPSLAGRDLVSEVTTDKPYSWHTNSWLTGLKELYFPDNSADYHIIVYDFGVKRSILNALLDRGCHVTVVPANTKAKQVLALKPDGIILSNGPGDPAACGAIIATIQELLKHAIPIMGICLGHQLLALASGAATKKMAFGHHGANHPILSLKTGAVSISSQNHGFVVTEENLPASLRITHRSLFDQTIAGIERIDVPAFSFQGHPEAGPGPMELISLFDHFISLIKVSYAKAS
jgi:carbamoyl-phosphate synthase small subunit